MTAVTSMFNMMNIGYHDLDTPSLYRVRVRMGKIPAGFRFRVPKFIKLVIIDLKLAV